MPKKSTISVSPEVHESPHRVVGENRMVETQTREELLAALAEYASPNLLALFEQLSSDEQLVETLASVKICRAANEAVDAAYRAQMQARMDKKKDVNPVPVAPVGWVSAFA